MVFIEQIKNNDDRQETLMHDVDVAGKARSRTAVVCAKDAGTFPYTETLMPC